MAERRLTKEGRDLLRKSSSMYRSTVWVRKYDFLALLDDLDAADAKIAEYSATLADRTKERDDARWRYEDRRQEIARLTTALAETDCRAKESEEALVAMWDECKTLRSVARMIYRRYVGGDAFRGDDEALMRKHRICDNDGFEIYDEEDEGREDA